MSEPQSQFHETEIDLYDINPIHLIRECLINVKWGMGYPVEDLNNESFINAAQTLYDEGFGLSFIWDQCGEIEEFITEILRHIDAVLFLDQKTGQFVIKLIRVDYDVDELPIIGPEQIIEITDYYRRTQTELINTLTLTYTDGHTHQDVSITIHDLALIQAQGQIIPKDVTLHGISNSNVANAVAMRELKTYSTEISKITIICNRECSHFTLGDVFKLQWPDYGIETEIMRISSIQYGSLEDNKIAIEAVQDFNSLQDSVYIDSPISKWEDPINYPEPSEHRVIIEMPYLSLVHIFGEHEIIWDEIGPDENMSYVMYGADKPTNDSYHYFLSSKTEGKNYSTHAQYFPFAPYAILDEDIGKLSTVFSISIFSSDIYKVRMGTFAVLNDELIKIIGMTTVPPFKLYIHRAVLDTTPKEHSAGDKIIFIQQFYGTDRIEYVTGEEVFMKARSVTAKGILPVSLAPEDSIVIDNRFIRPYPPGNFRLNDKLYPIFIRVGEDIEVTWNHRDRLQQTAYIVEQEEGNIGPEEGTTYTIRMYDENDELLREETEIEGTSYIYTNTQEKEDLGLDRLNSKLTIQLFSVRDEWESWQKHEHTIYRHALFILKSSSSQSEGNNLSWVAEVE